MHRESTTVAAGGLHYWRIDRGSTETVLMLHGQGGDHCGLAELAGELAGAGDVGGRTGPNVIVPDLPGYGESDPLPGVHSLVGYADTIEELRIGLGLGRVHLLGHSLGASIALVHAARYGFGLHSLCLLNPVTTAHGATAALGKLYYRIGAALPPAAARLWLVSKPAVYLSDAFIIVTRDRARRRWILRQDYLNYRRANVRAMVESFLSYFDTPFDAYAATTAVPTLLLTGDRDGLAPPTEVTRLADRMPAARHLVLPGAGHLVPVEHPGPVAEHIRAFLADPTDPRSSGSPVRELTH